MSRTPLLAGNWKMHTTISAARELAAAIAAGPITSGRQVLLAPPMTALAAVGESLSGSPVELGSQNICWEEQGAFTGEISPAMLKDVGGTMAIIGHSERRAIFGETDQLINTRVKGALSHGIIPILCIGETLEQRENGSTMALLEEQLKAGLAETSLDSGAQLVVAYEPVWAIGTGKTATSRQAQEVHAFVRNLLGKLYQKDIAGQIRILYGGSVNPANVDELMGQEDIDGALVGGAALKADSFLAIINFN
ncbi:MAG: triose-phosphate isomerase [Thermodesulfobacteriota bacterium]